LEDKFKVPRSRVYGLIAEHKLKSEYYGKKRTISLAEFSTAINTPRKVA